MKLKYTGIIFIMRKKSLENYNLKKLILIN